MSFLGSYLTKWRRKPPRVPWFPSSSSATFFKIRLSLPQIGVIFDHYGNLTVKTAQCHNPRGRQYITALELTKTSPPSKIREPNSTATQTVKYGLGMRVKLPS